MAIGRRLGLPRRTMVVLEGEGLANDATALILYKFAVAAVATGTFSFGPAFLVFLAIVAGEIAFGLASGMRACGFANGPQTTHRNPPVPADAIRRLLGAAYLGGSGVLAACVCGSTSAGTGRC